MLTMFILILLFCGIRRRMWMRRMYRWHWGMPFIWGVPRPWGMRRPPMGFGPGPGWWY